MKNIAWTILQAMRASKAAALWRTARSGIDVQHAASSGASLRGICVRSHRRDASAAPPSVRRNRVHRLSFWFGRGFLRWLSRQGFWRRFLQGHVCARTGDRCRGLRQRSRRRDGRRRSAHGENQRLAAARAARIAALLGLVAGSAASPAAAFAVLTPLIRPIGGVKPSSREAATTALALAISASQGVVVLAPVPIAAAAILDAAWGRVALFGLPLAVLLAALGAAWARWIAAFGAASVSPAPESHPIAEKQGGGSARRAASGDGNPADDADRPVHRRHSERAARWRGGPRDDPRSRSSADPLSGRGGPHGDRPRAARPQASF